MGKLAIKLLTNSDLTVFEWQFRNRNAGNQKSINLNADVFVEELYPSLPETEVGRNGRIPIDLFLYGPGNALALNLQRKIIKGDSYKNWRLNGEYISNPLDSPERFDCLTAGDFVVFDFEGDLYPTVVRAVFVASARREDELLHVAIRDRLGSVRMQRIEPAELQVLVRASGTPESHPIYELLLASAIEDAALSGLDGTNRILGRNSGRALTRPELERARQRADDIGREGEELLNCLFGEQQEDGSIAGFSWVSLDNAVAPFDFMLNPLDGTTRRIEVKSTNGDFNQIIHLSLAQLRAMSDGSVPYDLYRLYNLDGRTAYLRIAHSLCEFAIGILERFEDLPEAVTVDSISVRPDTIIFGEATRIEIQGPGNLEERPDRRTS